MPIFLRFRSSLQTAKSCFGAARGIRSSFQRGRSSRLILLLLAFLAAVLSACSSEPSEQSPDRTTEGTAVKEKASDPSGRKNVQYTTIEWTDLMPEDDLEILLNPPESIQDIPEGSEYDVMPEPMGNVAHTPEEQRYYEALASTRIKEEFHQQSVRIPGFIVPLEYDAHQTITSFFLVPFFGACIHVPPPPPNQIIYASYERGIQLDVLYDAFYITGTLHTELISNDMATAAYTMVVDSITPYEEYEE